MKMNLFYVSKDGTPQKLGDVVEIKEISEPDTSEDAPQLNLGWFTLTINLSKIDKKVWAKIFQNQKYKVTEWMFPKKKKRGTARRIRRRKGDADERL